MSPKAHWQNQPQQGHHGPHPHARHKPHRAQPPGYRQQGPKSQPPGYRPQGLKPQPPGHRPQGPKSQPPGYHHQHPQTRPHGHRHPGSGSGNPKYIQVPNERQGRNSRYKQQPGQNGPFPHNGRPDSRSVDRQYKKHGRGNPRHGKPLNDFQTPSAALLSPDPPPDPNHHLVTEIVNLALPRKSPFEIHELHIETITSDPSRGVYTLRPPRPLAANLPKDLALRILRDEDDDLTALFTVAEEVNWFYYENRYRPVAILGAQGSLPTSYTLVNIEYGEFRPGTWEAFVDYAATAFPPPQDLACEADISEGCASGIDNMMSDSDYDMYRQVYPRKHKRHGPRYVMVRPDGSVC